MQKGDHVPGEKERLKEGYTLEELKEQGISEGISQEKIELHAAVGVDDVVKLIVNNRERNIFKLMTQSVVGSGVLLDKERGDALFSQSEIVDSESDSTDFSIFQEHEMLFHRGVESPTGNARFIPGDWEDKNGNPVDIKIIALQYSDNQTDQVVYRQLLEANGPFRRRQIENPDFKSIFDVLNDHNTCSKEVDRYLRGVPLEGGGRGITKEVAASYGMSLNQSIREPAPELILLSHSRVPLEGGKDFTEYPIKSDIHIPVSNPDNPIRTKHVKYTACGVVFHSGRDPKSGHYFSCTKIGRQWYILNDSSLPEPVEWGHFSQDTFGQNPSDEGWSRPTIIMVLYQQG